MPPKLMDEVVRAIRLHHYSYQTEKAYCQWIRRYILFHDKRHPRTLGSADITQYLSYLATERHVAFPRRTRP